MIVEVPALLCCISYDVLLNSHIIHLILLLHFHRILIINVCLISRHFYWISTDRKLFNISLMSVKLTKTSINLTGHYILSSFLLLISKLCYFIINFFQITNYLAIWLNFLVNYNKAHLFVILIIFFLFLYLWDDWADQIAH